MNNLEFRAWHKLTNKYANIDSIHFNNQIVVLISYPFVGSFGLDKVAFDEVIIEQYTGLKDKNGKKIYEGDIALVPWINEIGVCSEDDYIRQKVVYEQDGFLCKDVNSIKMAKDGDGGAYLTCFLDVDGQNCIEVIGNIHENPELLGKEVEQ